MEVITVINQKGGVGKTTTAQSLGAGLQKRGKKVLLIDLDPQTNLTYTVLRKIPEKTIFNVFMKNENINNCIFKVGEAEIIPASSELSILDTILKDTGKEYRLKEALKTLKNDYDFIIIDTPPALGILTINSLTASNRAVITAQADIYSLQGIGQLNQTIQAVKKYCNENLKIDGVLLTRHNSRSILSRDMTENMKRMAESIGTKLYDSKIRECTAIKEAQATGQNIFDYSKKCNASIDYNNFIDEFLKGAINE